MFKSFVASAPGKIILAGEHAVVHGTRAIATVVDKRTNIQFSPTPFNTTLPSCDISLTVDYDDNILTHQWSLSDIIQHKDLLFQRCMDDIKDYTPCEDDGHQDHNHGIGSDCTHLEHKQRKYFTSVQKLLDYIQDHTYPNRHLHHKHHATLDQLTDIFDNIFSQLPVKVFKISKNDSNMTPIDTDPSTLHTSIEVCPAKVFLLFYFLFLLTSAPVIQHQETSQTFPILHCSITSDLPMGAGLGSSASVTSALAGGYYQILRFFPQHDAHNVSFTFTNADRQVINTWAFQGERIIHGTPSGVDNTCTVYGGVIAFRRVNGQPEMEFLPAGCIPNDIKIIITNTKQPKNTKALVAGVHELNRNYQFVIQPIFTAIEQITGVLLTTIRQYIDRESTFIDENEVFRIFQDVLRINQCLLDGLGVGHPKINQVLRISEQYSGDLITKLTGAGGGGCVISLTKPGTSNELIDQFQVNITNNNMDSFVTVMGQGGVHVELL
jgi:mevalonate kinase